MNFDPTKYKYEVVAAPAGQSGVQVVVTRLETGQTKVFPSPTAYDPNHTVDSAGLHQHMQSLTDELLLDLFEKKKNKKGKNK